jgi:hypothetical protein
MINVLLCLAVLSFSVLVSLAVGAVEKRCR